MEIYEKINAIIKKQKITKREFAQRLIALEPKLKTTGETPTEKTIYKYLNGTIAIRIELIPYIAQTLNITEQELFFTSQKERIIFYRKLVQNANDVELEIIKKKVLTKYELETMLVSYVEEKNIPHQNTKKGQVMSLLSYAPDPLLDSLIIKLKEIKQYSHDIENIR